MRPLSITIVACLYILVGIVGFLYHLPEFAPRLTFAAVEILRLIAVIAGIYLLRARNWARWTALAWIAVHVVIGALNSLPQFAFHAVFCALVAWVLFRPAATRYFHPSRP